jgi:hypothetical protein
MSTQKENAMHRPIHAPRYVVAAVVGGALLVGAAAPVEATAAGAPLPTVAQLEATLAAIPGVGATQIQALTGDLTAFANGGPAPNLGTDLDSVLAQIGQASGQPGLVQPVADTVNGLVGTVPTTAQLAQTIAQLEGLAGTGGITAPVGAALSQLASELTTADLGALLAQAGSPLSSSAVQQILSELAALQSLPVGGSVPAGLLSAVGQALDTIAAQPGVPAAAASALQNVAAELGSGGPLNPSTLTPALQTLAGAIPAVQSTPGTGPALSSVLGSLTTQLAASPPANGGNGAPGGAGGTGSYVRYLQSPPTVVKATTGATIRAMRYRKGHVLVTVACPAAVHGRCHTTIYLKVGSSRISSKQLTIAAGKARTANTALSHKATSGKHGRTIGITATAVTGNYATTRTIHIHIK